MLNAYKKTKRVKKPKDGTKKKFKGSGLRIVDEDDAFGYGRANAADSSDDEQAEELPQIAAVVDERPREMQLAEERKQGKWKQLEVVADDSPDDERRRHDSDNSDSSSKNRRRHDSDGDLSPPRSRRRHDSDGDLSPPRSRRRHDSDGDLSPPRSRRRHDSDGDLSPPRSRQRHDSDGDLSPPRNRASSRRDDSDGDLSPPRNQQNHSSSYHNTSKSRPKSRYHDSDGDLSPPRPGRRNDSKDIKPISKKHQSRKSSDYDLSPPRSPPGSSPPRRPRSQYNSSSKRNVEKPEIIDEGKRGSLPGTTLEGKKAGLQRAEDLRKEMVDYKRKENEMFANLDDEVSGRNARAKIRDKATGRERDLNAEMAKKQEEERIAAEKKALYDKWGKGLKQVEAQETRINEALHEVSKPLARYADDKDLDEYLRNQVRDGDPMLKFLSKKKKSTIDGIEKPSYSGPPPLPNRFGIPPGYRWDGVDRSTGYEKEWFSRINQKKAFQEDAYKWSVEDL